MTFEEWYRVQYQPVLAACVAFGGDSDAAKEATDEAFSRALGRWDTVSQMASPGAWVCQVALNCVRRSWRRTAYERIWVRAQRVPTVVVSLPRPDLWAAVRALPIRQRTAIVLRYVADLPETEVAEAMGIARGTVAATLFAARTRLGSLVADDAAEEEIRRG